MRLANITKNYFNLVKEQLATTDAYRVEVYSLGNSTIIYTEAKKHHDLIITNKKRPLKKAEIDYAIKQLLHTNRHNVNIDMLLGDYLTEVSLHK